MLWHRQRNLLRNRVLWGTVFLLLLSSCPHAFSQVTENTSPNVKVLFIKLFPSSHPWTYTYARSCTRELVRTFGSNSMFTMESPAPLSLNTKELKEAYASLYRKKFQNNVDFIILWGDIELLPGVCLEDSSIPIIQTNWYIPPSNPLPETLTNRLYATRIDHRFDKTVQVIKNLKPDFNKLLVICGTSSIEKHFSALAMDQIPQVSEGIEVEYSLGESPSSLERRVSTLPKEAAVLFISLAVDKENHSHIPFSVLKSLCPVSTAPIFGCADSYIGTGCVGGYVDSARHSAIRAVRTIEGIKKGSLKPGTRINQNTGKHMYDWPALQQWGFSETKLPKDAIILHRPKSLLSRHPEMKKLLPLVLSTLVLLLGGLIYHLLKTRRLLKVITEQKIREAQLNARYSMILATTSEAVLAGDKKGNITLFNPGAEKIFGYTQKEALSMHVADLCPAGMEEEQEKLRQQVMAEGSVINHETFRLHSSGQQIPVEMSIHQMRDENGKLTGTATILRDISYRYEAEAEIRKFKEFFDQANVGMAIVSLEGNIEYINDYFAQSHGYSANELKGKNLSIFHTEPQMTQVQAINNRTASTGHYDPVEVWHVRKNGETFPMMMSGVIIKDREGHPCHLAATAIDTTEMKAMEQEKNELKKQFYQSQKLESVGRLAGGIAHDLNNLLSPIIGFSEVLLESNTDEDERESINEILSAGFKARDLVQQLLAFSRKQTLRYIPIDLNETISLFINLLTRTIREDIEIRFLPASKKVTILADKGQIEQVIMNLAVNASDAMPTGGKLTISTSIDTPQWEQESIEEEMECSSIGVLEVKDTGCGMDPKSMEQIFEPFFTTKGDKGTGLGLSTVYGIIKQHGGHVSCTSEPGKGTCFRVFLPLTIESPIVQSKRTRTLNLKGGTESILVVEDNSRIRRLTSRVLTKHGYQVHLAASGGKALELLSNRNIPIDLLLTDVIMPEIDGKTLAEDALNLRPELKIIYMSGYTDDVIDSVDLDESGRYFIQKPFSMTSLLTKVRNIIDGEQKESSD